MWGIIEFGRLLVIYTEVSNAAREAVRYGVARGTDAYGTSRYLDCTGIRDAGTAVTALTPLDPNSIQIAYDHGGETAFATCADQPSDVIFGDRLVITITHQVQPLILFQDAGPFKVQFSTARTIVEEGIPLEGYGGEGDGDGPPGEAPTPEVAEGDPAACSVVFAWNSVDGADGYHLYQSVPTPTVQINGDILGLQYPESGALAVSNGDEFYVTAYNDAGDGPPSAHIVINSCLSSPLNFTFILDQPSACEGFFTWDGVAGADGYHLEETSLGRINGDISGTRYPVSGNMSVINGQTYTVNGFNDKGEGLTSSPVSVSGCTIPAPPAVPTNLSFVLDQAAPPCQGHFTWDSVTDADGYRLYQGAGLVGEASGPQYPYPSGQMNVTNGDSYSVTAFNAVGESAASNSATVAGCTTGSGPVSLTFYFHSNPTPPTWHAAAPPPLTMDATSPAHNNLYNYNDADPSKPGRLVSKGGGTPPCETNPDKYLEWRSEISTENLEFLSDVTVYLWGKNPINQILESTTYLYDFDGSSYQYIGHNTFSWGKNIGDWQLSQITISASGNTIAAGHQLVVWLISSNSKSLQFAYDTTNYDSRIEFTGEWLP